MGRIRIFRADERGALIVEFALIVPILFFLVFGIVDFGRAYFTMNNLAAAVREGARYGAVLPSPVPAWASDSMSQRVIDFSYTFGGIPLQKSQVTSAIDVGTETATVTANYTFRPITPLLRMINMDSIPMTERAVFRWEFGGGS
ncbi:MAG TPA: TadE/TadG family type IV pilus assembly protein [Gemmatimonadaceae bacterium]|nr:TadE/TadG family type IV pilus assembly protein [Gemmatimonadaceae bacterium]